MVDENVKHANQLKHYLKKLKPLSTQVPLSGDDCVMVDEGDQLAFMNPSATTVVGFIFSNTNQQLKQATYENTPPEVGDRVSFDESALPYQFALAAIVDEGKPTLSSWPL